MNDSDNKKALAVVAGPYRLYQVLWLYTQFKEYEWSIILLQYGNNPKSAEKLYGICKELNIFKEIFYSQTVIETSPFYEKVFLVIKMFYYFITGRKKKYMKRLVLQQTKGEKFDTAFVGCEYSILEGALIGLADEKEVYIFEEGLGDYQERKKYPSANLKELGGYLFSKMGYFNPGGYFQLENTKRCIKYASMPNSLKYYNYKSVRTLFNGSQETRYEFRELLNKAYPIRELSLSSYDIILLTTPMDGFVKDEEKYNHILYRWFFDNFKEKKILIKKHPRDTGKYEWEGLDCSFLSSDVPAEIFMEFVGKQKIILMYASTVLLSLPSLKKDVYIIKFDDIHGEYEKKLDYSISLLKLPEDHLIHL